MLFSKLACYPHVTHTMITSFEQSDENALWKVSNCVCSSSMYWLYPMEVVSKHHAEYRVENGFWVLVQTIFYGSSVFSNEGKTVVGKQCSIHLLIPTYWAEFPLSLFRIHLRLSLIKIGFSWFKIRDRKCRLVLLNKRCINTFCDETTKSDCKIPKVKLILNPTTSTAH